MAKNFSRLPALPSLKDFLHIYRLHAKKILSQNYLMDMNLTRKIVRYAGIATDDVVAEIGPGPGSITRAILETNCKQLDVIEIDHRFIPALQVLREASDSRLNIHHGDILKTDLRKIWLDAGVEKKAWHDGIPKLHIIGNLPFNIATPLIIKYLKEMLYRTGPWTFGRVPLTLTFQLEVAQRICGQIDSPNRARISIMSMFVSEPKLVFTIPGRCFVPRPEVDVGVVRFVPREEPLIKAPFELVEKLCRQLFNIKRKYVQKGVRTLYPKELSRKLSDDLLSRCRIDPTSTCTQIGIEQFADMCSIYEEQCYKYPGIYFYDHFHKQLTMEQLSNLPNKLPPANPFTDHMPTDGISLSKAADMFDS